MKEESNNTIQAFWVALGSLSSFGLAIVSAAILSRYFDKVQYGSYKQILFIYSTLLFVFTAGLPKVFAYFLPRYSLQEGKAIVWKISKLLFFSGLLFSVFLFAFSGTIAELLGNNNLKDGLKIFSPIPMLLLPTLGVEGIFSTYKKTKFIAIYNTSTRIIMLLCIIGPVILLNGTFYHALYGWITGSFLTFLLALYFKGIPFRSVDAVKSGLKFKDIFGYSVPLVIASAWSIALKSADQFYISRYFGADVFAEFSNGFIQLPFVAMVTSSTTIVLMPIFSKVFHENEGIDGLLKTWRNTLRKSALIIYPLVIFFLVYAKEVMVLLYSEAYSDSAIYFRINMILNFFNIIIFGPLFFASGRTKIFAKVHMYLAFLIWITGYILILLFNSPVAIAINSTVINVLKILILIFLAAKFMNVGFFQFFPLKIFSKLLLHCALIAAATKIIFFWVSFEYFILLELAGSFIVYGILILLTAPIFGINYLEVLQPLIKRLTK